jgi:protein-tyrosine phosphatase
MYDFHCHILPGVDDGSPDLESSLAMASTMLEQGFTHVAASPHIGDGPGGDVLPDANTKAREALQKALDAVNIPLVLLPNAEHLVSPLLFERLPAGATTIGGTTHWLLVELPWDELARPEHILFHLQTKGYRLLLAHPERYSYLETDAVERLVERGVRMQVELGSFIDVYGARARGRARAMADRGLIHVLASDLHRPKQATEWLGTSLAAVRRELGEAAVRAALVDNPQSILNDATTEAIVPMTAP